jgi:hypothetical protein
MGLTSQQLALLRAAGSNAVSPAHAVEGADLQLLIRAGLVVQDDGGRLRRTEAGRRYVEVDGSKPHTA